MTFNQRAIKREMTTGTGDEGQMREKEEGKGEDLKKQKQLTVQGHPYPLKSYLSLNMLCGIMFNS